MLPADQGPLQVEATAGAASASTRNGVSNFSFRKSATHIGATRASSIISLRLSFSATRPRRARPRTSFQPFGVSGGGSSLRIFSNTGWIRDRKDR